MKINIKLARILIYFLCIILLLFSVIAIHENGEVHANEPWHPLQQIAIYVPEPSEPIISVDMDSNGIIDEAKTLTLVPDADEINFKSDIGDSTHGAVLNIKAGSGKYSSIDFYDGASPSWGIGKDTNGKFYIDEADTDGGGADTGGRVITIDSSRNIGIRTSPITDEELTVLGDIRVTDGTDYMGIRSDGTALDIETNNALYINNNKNFDIYLVAGTSTGKVGIGTTNPSSKLHVSAGTSGDAELILEADTDDNNEADNPFITFKQDNNAVNAFIALEGTAGTRSTGTLANALVIGSEDDNPAIQFITNDNVRMTLNTDGKASVTSDLSIGGELKGIKPDGSSCLNNQILKYDDTDDEWNCEEDIDATYSAGQGLSLVGTIFNVKDCASNQVLKRNGGDTDWICATDAIDDSVSSSELDNICNTDTKILKRSSGTWVCADDADTDTQQLFKTINVPSGTDPVADSTTDTLNLVASGIVSLTGDSGTDTITIGATESDPKVGTLTNNKWCTSDGNQVICNTNGDAGIPSGAVMFFNLASCPVGWSELTSAQGMYIVGLPSGGTLAGTQGTALSNLEDRAVGRHTHAIADGGHVHEVHPIPTTMSCAAGCGDSARSAIHGSYNGNTRSATTGITINNAGSVAGTNAPYIQLLVCQKD